MKTYLYRHFNKNNDLLYVGISYSVLNRTRNHSVCAHWFDQIDNIKIESFPSRADAIKAETTAIQNENPLFNIAQSSFAAERLSSRKEKTVFEGITISKDIQSLDCFYTVSEISKLLNVSTKRVKFWINNGLISYFDLPSGGKSVDQIISGWHVLDFLETVEKKVSKQ